MGHRDLIHILVADVIDQVSQVTSIGFHGVLAGVPLDYQVVNEVSSYRQDVFPARHARHTSENSECFPQSGRLYCCCCAHTTSISHFLGDVNEIRDFTLESMRLGSLHVEIGLKWEFLVYLVEGDLLEFPPERFDSPVQFDLVLSQGILHDKQDASHIIGKFDVHVISTSISTRLFT